MVCDIDNCNLYETRNIIKHKWIPIIIYILNKGEISYTNLLNSILYISDTQLSLALKKLKEDSLIEQTNQLYTLSSKGQELGLIIELMQKFTINQKNTSE